MNVISVKARKMRAVLPRLPTLTSTHSSSTSTTGPPPASTVEYSDLPLSGVTVNVPQLTMSSTLIVGGRPVAGALPRRARPLPRGDCMPGRLPQPTPAPGGLSVVHCVHQPCVSVSNWATEQPAAIPGTAPTPGPMNCGTPAYRRVSHCDWPIGYKTIDIFFSRAKDSRALVTVPYSCRRSPAIAPVFPPYFW